MARRALRWCGPEAEVSRDLLDDLGLLDESDEGSPRGMIYLRARKATAAQLIAPFRVLADWSARPSE